MTEDTDTAMPVTTKLQVSFPGTGRAYFGIWIVNLLLMVLTLGLYYPWARVRKLQFFASNTEIGAYPMHFHGVPRRMFGGFIIAAIGFALYVFADLVHPLLGGALVIAFALIWPALLRAALRFRLRHTSWRGIRLAFSGSLGQAYAAVAVPLIVVAVVAVIAALALPDALIVMLAPEGGGMPRAAAGALAGLAAIMLILVPLTPYIHYRVTRYRQSNIVFASERSQFDAGPLGFYVIYALVVVLGLGLGTVLIGSTMLFAFGFETSLEQVTDAEEIASAFAGAAMFVILIALVFAWLFTRALFEASLFNLVWNNTRSEHLTCAASLSIFRLFFVRLTNTILTAITLGLYTPFAQVRLARVQRAALAITAGVSIDDLLATMDGDKTSAASDAAADLFDLDIGL